MTAGMLLYRVTQRAKNRAASTALVAGTGPSQ